MAEKKRRSSSPQQAARRAAFTLTLCLLALGFMSCGTIRGLNKLQVVNFTSPEPGVEFEIYNGAGKLVFAGKTPTQVMLKASKWSVSERYYVKSGGRVEVFQGDFGLLTYGLDIIPGMVVGLYVDVAASGLHSLQSEQELGNVYLNVQSRIVGKASDLVGGEE
jgi:hypothetical protein